MRALGKFAAVVLLLVLVVAGLNASSQGINQLTMNNQGPVFAIYKAGREIDVLVMGRTYHCSQPSGHEIQALIMRQGIKLQGKLLNHWQECRRTWFRAGRS